MNQHYKKASFIQRLSAYIIDVLILLAVLFPLGIAIRQIVTNNLWLIGFLITATYNIFFVARTGATIGKKLLRLKVVDTNYNIPTFKQIVFRETIGKLISHVILGVGFLWILNDKKRQALHDRLAKTYVVKLDSEGSLMLSNDEEKIHLISRAIFWVVTIVLLFPLALGIFYTFFGLPFRVGGKSMMPAYKNGEYVLVRKSISFKRSDVIVYNINANGKIQQFIKRIVGLPGETVMIKNSDIFINGKKLNQSRVIAPNTKTPAGTVITEGVAQTVPKNYYFVLGDNRTASLDSRDMGFIPQNAIVGRVWTCYWNCK